MQQTLTPVSVVMPARLVPSPSKAETRQTHQRWEHYRFRIPEGKDTMGNGGKPREAYLLKDVEGDIHRYQNAKDIDSGEPLVDLTKRTAEETGDDD